MKKLFMGLFINKTFSYKSNRIILYTCILLIFFISSNLYAYPSVKSRRERVELLAKKNHWHQIQITTPLFVLAAYIPDKFITNIKTLTIYIEGDGLSWLSSSTISPDPTPLKPTTLLLALKHPDNQAVYLARPFQYINSNTKLKNPSKYWTSAIYSTEVVKSMNIAVDKIKDIFKANNINIVGFSGGGVITALISARRKDVNLLTTIAANLDLKLWSEHHNLNYLKESLNPIDEISKLQNTHQIHLAGENDSTVPAFIIRSFIEKFPDSSPVEMITIANFHHTSDWQELWPDFLKKHY